MKKQIRDGEGWMRRRYVPGSVLHNRCWALTDTSARMSHPYGSEMS